MQSREKVVSGRDGWHSARPSARIVCWCTTIALHQEFGVRKIRLDRITDRMNELEEQNTSVIMTPDANGRPSKQKADSIRESWLAGIVDSDYRVPMIRAPKNRKEEQYWHRREPSSQNRMANLRQGRHRCAALWA